VELAYVLRRLVDYRCVDLWLLGFETQGRSIEEIDSALDRPLPASPRPVQQTAGN
jgi:hypothetical protein